MIKKENLENIIFHWEHILGKHKLYTMLYLMKRKKNQNGVQEFQRGQMRGHHHEFKEQNNILMTSKYNDDYNKQATPNLLQANKPNENLKQKAAELRFSHIILGKDQVPFTSVAKKDYYDKSNGQPISKQVGNSQSHFDLGNNQEVMCTTNDIYHDYKPITVNKLAEETKNDLISSHFKLGADFSTEQVGSESANNYKWPQKNSNDQGNLATHQLQKNHFQLGDSKHCYQTSYSTNMKGQQPDTNNLSKDQSKDRSANFQLGNQGNSYATEMNQRFRSVTSYQTVQMNQAQKNNLRASHFNFNDVGRNTYQTSQKVSYQTKDTNQSQANQIQKRGENQVQNFNFGSCLPEYASTYTKCYVKQNGGPSKLNDSVKAELLRNHFKIG
eukprot:TRINITY_DN424_c0_g1_i4.p1 TRINITY_DN424_c0_g1~~TRINITY_DN424_c0_g1_i4.p1  ORF type:complete len:385 (+),score=61.68 TRINITY_DN424_c0_g1_i4:474-1628(+)